MPTVVAEKEFLHIVTLVVKGRICHFGGYDLLTLWPPMSTLVFFSYVEMALSL